MQEIMIIKAMRLQTWAPAGGGARVSRHPPPPQKNSSLAILGAFLLLFLHMGPFLLRFSHFWGSFHHVQEPFCYFLLHGGGFFGGVPPPPLRKFLRAPMIARRVREHAPRKFFV